MLYLCRYLSPNPECPGLSAKWTTPYLEHHAISYSESVYKGVFVCSFLVLLPPFVSCLLPIPRQEFSAVQRQMGHLIPILRGPGRVFVTMIPTIKHNIFKSTKSSCVLMGRSAT
jgi:hypothetical protein